MKLLVTQLILSVMCLSACCLNAQADGVTFAEQPEGRLQVMIDGKDFCTFNTGDQWNKPFVFPMHTASEKNVLRTIVPTQAEQGSAKDGTDHFHHKGVWVGVDSVNDEKLNFWHEESRVDCQKIEHTVAENGVGIVTLTSVWLQEDKPLMNEVTQYTIHPNRLLTCRIELSAVDRDVTFHDTKEGFFAVRVAHSMREMEGGRISNAEGLKGEKDCWGKTSPWVDYVGEVDGQTVGVALMDAPENFRKSRYHVRAYGLFAISPFGPSRYSNGRETESPVTLSPGKENLKLTYGLYVHDGDTEAGGVAAAYQQFLKAVAPK
ncbi:MAG: PmoA family protein [Planctomycetaceae bacterium]